MKFKQVLLSLKPYFKIPYEGLVWESKVTCLMCDNVVDVECKYCCSKCCRPDSNYKVQNNWYKKYDTDLDAILHTGTLFGDSTHKRITKTITCQIVWFK